MKIIVGFRYSIFCTSVICIFSPVFFQADGGLAHLSTPLALRIAIASAIFARKMS
jgi:hypothetical protein